MCNNLVLRVVIVKGYPIILGQLSFLYRVFIKYCVFFEDFKIFRSLFSLGVNVCHTHQAGRTPALQQNWQNLEKSQNYKKNTIINEHPVSLLTAKKEDVS